MVNPAHVFIAGRTQSGKTRAAVALALRHPGPVVFVNTQEEQILGAGWTHAGPQDQLSSFLRALRRGRRILFVPSSSDPAAVREIQVLVSAIFGAAPWRRPLLLVVDEAHVYAPQGRRPGPLHRVARRGLRWGVQMVLISQRPADVDKGLVSQCADHRIFVTTWEGGYFQAHGVPADQVKAILEAAEPYSFVRFDGATVTGPFKEIL